MAEPSLDRSEWDVVIVGTGFQESMLALSLAKSGLEILHIDQRPQYGGAEASLSLVEAETWADQHGSAHPKSLFASALLGSASARPDVSSKLGMARQYNLALAPQVIHCQSDLIKRVVDKNLQESLDFVAIDTWCLYSPSESQRLVKVPGSREDLFANKAIEMRHKRALVKFLRFLTSYESDPDWDDIRRLPLTTVLTDRFKIPTHLHDLLLALVMLHVQPTSIITETALPRAARHLASIGMFGSTFAGVLIKWGGFGELNQACCRACAVGGGTYALGLPVKSVERVVDEDGGQDQDGASSRRKYTVLFENGDAVTTRWLVGFSAGDIPDGAADLAARSKPSTEATAPDQTQPSPSRKVAQAVYVVGSPLSGLFPHSSDGVLASAGAVIYVPHASVPVPDELSSSIGQIPPVYLIIHGSASSECPAGETVVYASMDSVSDQVDARILRHVVETVIPAGHVPDKDGGDKNPVVRTGETKEQSESTTMGQTKETERTGETGTSELSPTEENTPEILWSLTYTRQTGPAAGTSTCPTTTTTSDTEPGSTIHLFPPFAAATPTFDDSALLLVDAVSARILADVKKKDNPGSAESAAATG